ncbi:MAG: hypothetical protein K6E33_04985 [Lachnospiraceae bacterium]|nr:hypothetical protein [Lachnospiraceae bacterium]
MEEASYNGKRKIELRRLGSYLKYAGRAVFFFGIWDAIKTVITMFLNPIVLGIQQKSDMNAEEQLTQVLSFAVLGIVLWINILIRFYIGRWAIKEGNGERKGLFPLLVTCVYLVIVMVSFVGVLKGFLETANMESFLISFIIELTSALALIIIVVCSWRVRYLEHKVYTH